ncbi:hypothetical protein [Streptomyces sp. NBC_00658]|uniref:hypothetical protein n=1 Tax=Streptomyces sp. NBC_00658 TaxID=2975800 RepID=UPI003244231F
MPPSPPLIAVIGPVEPALLTAWVHHYRSLGVEQFLLAFHFPGHVDHDQCHQLLHTCREMGIAPEIVSRGPWHEHTNPHLRDALRERAGEGWHLLADSDELHTYPAPLDEVIAEAARSGIGTVGGLMLDRVSNDGTPTGWDPDRGLDTGYPLGGFLTHHLLRADPRKIVLAHSGITVASGNHRAEGHRPANRPPVPVHHFKWRAGVGEDAERRASHSDNGIWKTASPARLSEARRLLDHLQRHDGRIGVGSSRIPFRPVTLQAVPGWWAEEATRLVATWRPPAWGRGQKDPGGMISSPSS